MQNAPPLRVPSPRAGSGRAESASTPGRRERRETRQARWIERASVSLKTNMPSENGSGEAIQSCTGPRQRHDDEPRRPSGRFAPTRVGLGDDLAELFVGEPETVVLVFPGLARRLPRRESPHSDGKKRRGPGTAAVLVTSGLRAREGGPRHDLHPALFLVVLHRALVQRGRQPFLIMSCGCRLANAAVS